MVRSVTRVNEALLAGKAIKVRRHRYRRHRSRRSGVAAAGGIGFSAAPGCNAIAVVEYVFSSLLMLAERDGFALRDRTVGIVGVGNVGATAKAPGSVGDQNSALRPAARPSRRRHRVTSARWMRWFEADVITFHTPLYKEGPI